MKFYACGVREARIAPVSLPLEGKVSTKLTDEVSAARRKISAASRGAIKPVRCIHLIHHCVVPLLLKEKVNLFLLFPYCLFVLIIFLKSEEPQRISLRLMVIYFRYLSKNSRTSLQFS